jgi:hypothetical protein
MLFFLVHVKKNIVQRNVAEKKFLQAMGDEKKFVHRKIAQTPPLKYLMVRP